jgi:ferredoxin
VDGFSIELTESDAPDFAFMGVRACDLNAIKIQDRIYMGDEYEDPSYKERREGAFIIALNCSEADDTCFCVSMDCGPEADEGYDLALTEIYEEQRHDFLVDIGSKRGAEVMEAVRHAGASDDDRDRARKIVESTAQQMGRELNTDGIKDLLYENLEHPQWDEVAERCLGCANCTLVCPTCFCSTVEDTSELDDDHTERWIRWDSCFNAGHSHLAGAGSVHDSIKARYRQWLTHKLGTWIDQFGSSGCTGCGRCITWCPVAIDLTEQVEKLRKEPSQGKEHESKTEEND